MQSPDLVTTAWLTHLPRGFLVDVSPLGTITSFQYPRVQALPNSTQRGKDTSFFLSVPGSPIARLTSWALDVWSYTGPMLRRAPTLGAQCFVAIILTFFKIFSINLCSASEVWQDSRTLPHLGYCLLSPLTLGQSLASLSLPGLVTTAVLCLGWPGQVGKGGSHSVVGSKPCSFTSGRCSSFISQPPGHGC